MTLVVARHTDAEIRIVSDFRITDSTTLHNGPLKGAPKSVVLSRTTCVCYAGNATRALLAIREAATASEMDDTEDLAHRLLRVHENGNHDSDFIVAGMIPRSRLFRISARGVEEDLSVAWIGDQNAFELYQTAYHAPPNRPFPSEMFTPEEAARFEVGGKMMEALRAVAANPSCPSVAEPLITLTSHPNGTVGFKYLDMAVGYDFQPVSNTTEETSLTRARSAAEGGYNYSVLTPPSPGVGAIGVHFFQGRFGALFYPLLQDDAIVFRNCNVDEFVQQVETRHRIRIDGFRWK